MTDTGYVFREHAGAEGAPTLFVFHGTGGDENQLFDLARQLAPEARIVAPRGDVSEMGALRYFRRTGEGVYDMDDLAERTARMAAFIKAQAGEGPVYGLGYSNGANILASVMLSAPEIVDAAVLMHPLIPWTPGDVPGLAGRKVLITAGRRDGMCPPENTQALADYLTRQGVATEVAWHEGGHEVAQTELAAVQRFVAGL
ncbi:alpha/beta hydrolase [Pelagibacterium xiamenense]|uniref:alpha/beta hydrolase n=1 Tax=Pelagibacterium xiamenense TaxID=2901140 RepID=UPI001E5FE30E|nr:alpha/beta hydrolase [Pelagibacterium xiamenense]MCD7060569.1 alpha/beta hydrolase [Pelagibacterium xiamenense]